MEVIFFDILKMMGYFVLLIGMRRVEIIEMDLRVFLNFLGNDLNKLFLMILDVLIIFIKG